jgi:hypothetical protein
MGNAVLSAVCVATVGIERLAVAQTAQQAAPKVNAGSQLIAKASTTKVTIDGRIRLVCRQCLSGQARRFDAMPRNTEALP